MTKDEARSAVMGAISMALKDPTLQQGFEVICKENTQLKEANQTLATMNESMWVELEKKRAESQGITNKLHQLVKAKYIMNVAIEGIKHWGIVRGSERPFAKQAEVSFNLFLEKAEQFISEVKE